MVILKNKFFLALIVLFTSLFWMPFAYADFQFNGSVYNSSGGALNNSLINVTVRNNAFTITGYNSTTTNASGWFNLTVTGPTDGFYTPVITHTNTTYNFTTFIGQALPAFPHDIFPSELSATNFFLYPAGTINITAVNSSGGRTAFNYQIKDSRLGFPITEDFTNYVTEAIVKVPRGRNYTIMIFPNQSMPLYLNWNNFSSTESYNFGTSNISSYNATTNTLKKQFNVTLSLVRVSGFINYSSISGWNEFTIVPFLLEPGNIAHVSDGVLPFNLSSSLTNSSGSGQSDLYNLTGNASYNISLPGTVEDSTMLLFAVARNGSEFFGGFKNISLAYNGNAVNQFNFSAMTGLLGIQNNISMNRIEAGAVNFNASARKQNFTLVNSTNTTLSNVFAHVEIKLNYSQLHGMDEFIWIATIDQSFSSATFSIPLLNNTKVKEMNIFVSGGAGSFAPRKLDRTVAQIVNNSNITINAFNPNAIDSQIAAASLSMALYTSNSSCDAPNPADSCLIGGSEQNMGNFKPMSSLIGGGKLSFRMGTGNIKVHYVNVDLIASGPPDALFDSSVGETSSDGFDAALRFGSLGPSIYDYILVGVPYTESAGSGLNDGAQVNMSMANFYDDNWNIIWNVTANGTNATTFSANYSYYSAKKSEWQTLMSGTSCTTNATIFNETNPCYLNTSQNVIWIRIPHFSGTGPSISGSVLPAASSGASSSSGSTGSGNATTNVKKTHSWTKITPGNATIMKIDDKDIGLKQISIEVNAPVQNVKISVLKHDGKPANVSTEKTGKVYKYIQIDATNLNRGILKKAEIEMQVEKGWLKEKNLSKDNIALFKFDEQAKEWKLIETKNINSDDKNEYYVAEVDSFSYFAIAQKNPDISEEPISAGGAGESNKTEEKTKTLKTTTAIILIIIIIITAIITALFLIKKNKYLLIKDKIKIKSP